MSNPISVLISDVHYTVSNLKLADNVMRQALDKARSLKVPLIVAGDLLDEKAVIRAECANSLINLLSDIDVRVIMIPGNHSMVNAKGTEHALNFLKPYVEVFDEPTYDEATGLWFVPYQNDLQAMLAILDHIPSGATIIAHQGVQSANMGHYVQDKTSLPREAFARHRVISGHYHLRQDIPCGDNMFSYIGNPFSLTFGEANDGPKGFRVLHADGSLGFVPTNLRAHRVVVTDLMTLPHIAMVSKDDPLWLKVKGPNSELKLLDKAAIGKRLLGHSNFKLDLLPTDSKAIKPLENLPDTAVLDSIIDALGEPDKVKEQLKDLWRQCAN